MNRSIKNRTSRAIAPLIALASFALMAPSCQGESRPAGGASDSRLEAAGESAANKAPLEASSPAGETGRAIFAGGCFWCMEPPYDKLDGVLSTISGYIGGPEKNPTYKQVSSGRTGHTEAVEVTFDPSKISYQELLDVFWVNIDPTVEDRQFCDWGSQYRTGIFYLDETQGRLAEASKQKIIESGRFPRVVTEVTAATEFYPAEEYHQDFYKKNPAHYNRYRTGCRRDARLAELWGEDR